MSTTESKAKARARQGGRKGPGTGAVRPSRAQIRAAEVRSAQTGAAAEAVALPAARGSGAGAGTGRAGTNRAPGRVVARPVALPRVEEYRYIRDDLRRLLFTAGSLLVLMLVLLVAIEG